MGKFGALRAAIALALVAGSSAVGAPLSATMAQAATSEETCDPAAVTCSVEESVTLPDEDVEADPTPVPEDPGDSLPTPTPTPSQPEPSPPAPSVPAEPAPSEGDGAGAPPVAPPSGGGQAPPSAPAPAAPAPPPPAVSAPRESSNGSGEPSVPSEPQPPAAAEPSVPVAPEGPVLTQAETRAANRALEDARETLPTSVQPNTRLLAGNTSSKGSLIPSPDDAGLLALIVAMAAASIGCAVAAGSLRKRSGPRHVARR